MAVLQRLPNVHRLGAVPSDEIPEYVSTFDVGIVPFVVDELTRAVSPLKMYEYLAAGVPVVATPLPVCVAHPMVRTAASVDGFASEIEAAAAERGTEEFEVRARAAADEASWDSRVEIVRHQLLEQEQLSVRP